MASSPSQPFPLLLLLTILSTFLVSEAATAAPGPTAGPANLTDILVKGGQYSTFLRLLNETQCLSQIQNQLNNSFFGLTVFAPTDNAFNSLKPGTLNALTSRQQVALVLYHVLARYYSLADFQTASNPVPTQASGRDGVYAVNITASARQQVNVLTWMGAIRVRHALHLEPPLAVYSIDDVLLPYDISGGRKTPPTPVAAASAGPMPIEKPKKGNAEAPTTEADQGSSPTPAASTEPTPAEKPKEENAEAPTTKDKRSLSTPAASSAGPTPTETPKVENAEAPSAKGEGSSGGSEGRGLVWGYAVGVLVIGAVW